VPWATLIALVLVLQTFASAQATGLGREQLLIDAFGNPLCITSSDKTGHRTPHGNLTECCTLACVGGGIVFGPPGEAAMPGAQCFKPEVVRFAAWSSILRACDRWTPANPRAPPAAA
jgi:hypothetical protein